MRERGHSMVELMIATTLLASFFAVVTSFGAQSRRSDRLAAAYVEDLTQCRRALESLEGDIRQARRVEYSGDALRVYLPEEVVDYRLRDGALTRTLGGRTTVVARRIGGLKAMQDGRLVKLRVAIQPRATNPVREATVHSTVYLRNGGRG